MIGTSSAKAGRKSATSLTTTLVPPSLPASPSSTLMLGPLSIGRVPYWSGQSNGAGQYGRKPVGWTSEGLQKRLRIGSSRSLKKGVVGVVL